MRISLIACEVVGQSFARTLIHRKAELIENYGIHPRVVAMADRHKPEATKSREKVMMKVEKGTVAASRGYEDLAMSRTPLSRACTSHACLFFKLSLAHAKLDFRVAPSHHHVSSELCPSSSNNKSKLRV